VREGVGSGKKEKRGEKWARERRGRRPVNKIDKEEMREDERTRSESVRRVKG
jgi:hypothetical protein